MYSVAKEPLGLSPLPSTSKSWKGVLETDSFSGKGKSSSDKTDLQHVAGQVPGISSAPPGSQTCLSLPQAGGQGDRTHSPLEDRPQTVGAVFSKGLSQQRGESFSIRSISGVRRLRTGAWHCSSPRRTVAEAEAVKGFFSSGHTWEARLEGRAQPPSVREAWTEPRGCVYVKPAS